MCFSSFRRRGDSDGFPNPTSSETEKEPSLKRNYSSEVLNDTDSLQSMECNRDEAARAKEIAENKFKMKDVAGAKKFALKAQSLYPEMEGVSQMLATLDVYIAAENKVNEEVNWYGILNASPRDDNETLKRKYRKLALMLHPDKNSSVGAEGAFKHVLEAWKFLSDKEKRAGYDRRKSLHTMYQKVSVSSSNSGFCNFAKPSYTSNARPPTQRNNPPPTQRNNPPPIQKNNPPTQKTCPQKPVGNTENTGRSDHHTTTPSSFTATGSSDQSKSNTFWTVCRRCNQQYEYLRTYVNRNILCPECLQSFSAQEVRKPGMSIPWSSLSHLKRNLDPKSAANHSTTSGSFSNAKWTFSRTSSPAHAAMMVQQAYEMVKKDREEAKATAKREKKNAKRKSTTTGSSASCSSLKKRKVIGETETGCSGGRKVTYCVTGETGRNMVKLHGTKERADKLSPRIKKKISKEGVTREVKSR